LRSREKGASREEATAPGNADLNAREAAEPLSALFVSPGWPASACANGVTTALATLLPALRRLGHSAFVLATSVRQGSGEAAEEGLYDLRREGATGIRGLVNRIRSRFDPLGATAVQLSQSVLHVAGRLAAKPGSHILEMEEAFGWPRRVRPRCPMPLVVRLHGPWFLNGPNNGADPASPEFARRVREEGRAIAAADGVTAPTRDVLERTRSHYRLPLEAAEVIPHPMPATSPERRWRAERCEPELILFVGRFDRHKGGDTIVDAFARVVMDRPAARLLFAGPDRGLERDGRRWTLREYVEHRLPGASNDGRVRWLGQRPHDELNALRQQAAVTVVASRYETFGITITEALAVGCPVVATRAGGAGEIFEHGIHGLYCPPDDPLALAASIGALLANPGHAAALGRRGAEYVAERYAPESAAVQTIDFYRRVLARWASRRARARG